MAPLAAGEVERASGSESCDLGDEEAVRLDAPEERVALVPLVPIVVLHERRRAYRGWPAGLEALPEIKRVAPAALVVVLSGFSASMVADDVLAQGANRYLEKGASPSLITETIEELVRPKANAVAPPMRG